MALVNGYRWRAYDVLRLVMALILLTAAGLKARQLMTEPVLGTVTIFVLAKMGLSPSFQRLVSHRRGGIRVALRPVAAFHVGP